MPSSASQTERIELIMLALQNKIGEGGMRHYGILEAESASRTESSPRTQTARLQGESRPETIEDNETPSANEGVYL